MADICAFCGKEATTTYTFEHTLPTGQMQRLVNVPVCPECVNQMTAAQAESILFKQPRVLVVGELNPFGMNPRYALYHMPRTSSGNRLRVILGLKDRSYQQLLYKVNLCYGKWDANKARKVAVDIMAGDLFPVFPVIVLLGDKVRQAFDGPAPFGTVVKLWGKRLSKNVTLVGLPHPSGRCLIWNEPAAKEQARAVLRKAAPWLPIGEELPA